MSSSQSLIAQPAAVMRALALLIASCLASPVRAAEIGLRQQPGQSHPIIDVRGEITPDDTDKLAHILDSISNKGDTEVLFSSEGGTAFEALIMGDIIRRTGGHTSVDDKCNSGCAFIWLAGAKRYAFKDSQIGFHGPFNGTTGQQDALLYARYGVYLGYLNISYEAAYWMLSPRQFDMHWLTPEVAEKLLIYVTWADPPPRSQARNERPLDDTTTTNPPPQQTFQLKMRVIEKLKLRALPDWRSEDVLSQWTPEDFIPAGVIFVWTTRDRKCQKAPDGYNWCYLTHAHHGIKTSGWVADRYLEEVP